MVFAWPVGIPLGLLWLLWRQWRSSREQWLKADLQFTTAVDDNDPDGDDRDALPEAGNPAQASSLAEFNAARIRDTFGFCTKDNRPACVMFEPIDMLRKLALSGLLQFVRRGTAFQVFCGCALSFGSCCLQIHVAPYSERSANLLKALVDAQIFVTFLVSFILRVLPQIGSSEPVKAATYGWVVVFTLSGLLVTAVRLTAHQIWQRHRGRRVGSAGDDGEGGEFELSEGLVLERELGSGGDGSKRSASEVAGVRRATAPAERSSSGDDGLAVQVQELQRQLHAQEQHMKAEKQAQVMELQAAREQIETLRSLSAVTAL